MRDMTYERLALVWLRDKKQSVAAGELAVAKFEIYRRTTLNHLIPRLGTLCVEDVKPIHIAAGLSTDVKTKRKLGRASVQKFRSVLHNQFEQAVRHELIVRNQVASTDRMGSSTAEVRQRGLTGDEFSALLKAAKGTDEEGYVVLALMTGARPSELLALQYGDLDFKKNTVRFTASLGRVKIGGPTVRKAMKTSKSERTLSVPPQALDAFREKKGKPDAFLFATSTGNPVNIRTFAQRVFGPFVTSAGMPSLTLYSLRHAHATTPLRNGEAASSRRSASGTRRQSCPRTCTHTQSRTSIARPRIA